MRIRKYKKLRDGEARVLKANRVARRLGIIGYKFMCCDCGLVHRMAIKVVSASRVHLTAWRDKRATAARRRRAKK